MKKLLLFLVLFGIAFNSISQDVILKRNNEKLNVKIIEISSTEIKYKMWGNDEGPINAIKKGYVHKIIYQNGSEEKYAPMYRDAERNYEKSRNTGAAIALSVLYPGAGQIYNKDYGRAAIFGGLYSFCIVGAIVSSDEGEITHYAIMIGTGILAIIDAPIRSKVINHRYNLASNLSNENFDIKLQPQIFTVDNYAMKLQNNSSLMYGASLRISLK